MQNLLEDLKDMEVFKELGAISVFYENVDKELSTFPNRFGVFCKKGCGECCAHFIPDLTYLESLFIAYHVLTSEKREMLVSRLEERKGSTTAPCPFYDVNSELHCMIYLARGLVCRLFNSSFFLDKYRKPVFKACRFGGDDKDINLEFAHPDVPLMSKYGEELEGLYGNTTGTKLLTFSVLSEIDKILMLASFGKGA